MNSHSLLKFLCVFAIGSASAQASTSIDFNDGTNGSAIDGFYSGLGATFSNAEWNNLITGYTPTDPTGLRLVAVGPDLSPKSGNPIIITFDQPATFASIVADNVNANGVRMDAYDATVGGSLVNFQQEVGASGVISSDANFVLSVTGASILRIELYQPFTVESEGVLFDNFTFTPIPEPGSFALLLGVVSLAQIFGRRRVKLQ